MDVATVLFTYNRSWHTGEVLNALSKNTILPEKLYIFQDGLKKEAHRAEWEKVNDLIRKVDFCPTQSRVLDKNIGVAESVVSGINYVLERHDAVIVLEDDCVPSVSFNQFMMQCLKKYREDKRVWCIGGCTDPVELKKDQYDVYGCGRTSSSGWGTWKDRWDKFCYDHHTLKRLKEDENGSLILATWGNDCEQILLSDIVGRCDAWDIYWTLLAFEHAGICVLPYQSLIRNIGWDGSGVHCGVTNEYDVKVFDGVVSQFNLPDQIMLRRSTKEAFVDLYGSYTAINEDTVSKENVLIYGLGKFFRQFEKDINEQYYIKAFIDRGQNGWYAGKKIIGLDEIAQYGYSKIVIMVQDVQETINIAKELLSKGIDAKKIVLGHEFYGKYGKKFENISVLPDGGFLLSFGNMSTKVRSKEEFVHGFEVFVEKVYHYHLNNKKSDIIMDVGMETGDTTLYFLNQGNVDKVYGYPLFEKAYITVKENLEDYYGKSERLEIFQYDMDKKDFRAILEKAATHNIVLKLEGKGREAEILKELSQRGVLDKLTLAMVSMYSEGRENIEELLKESGFSWRECGAGNGQGLIYAFRC